MELKAYLSAERGRAAALAADIGVSQVVISQWATHVREIPVARCTSIEAATGGAVKRWDLRPADWSLMWPELMGLKGAPRPFKKGAKATAGAASAAVGRLKVKVA